MKKLFQQAIAGLIYVGLYSSTSTRMALSPMAANEVT
jgi:hypothetical protein